MARTALAAYHRLTTSTMPAQPTSPDASARPSSASLEKAAREALEASDLLLISTDRLLLEGRTLSITRVIDRRAALRTHDAIHQTRSMLEQAAAIIQRAHASFTPIGTGNARLRA